MSRTNTFRRLMNWWPPFLGSGIKVQTVSPDFRHVRVRLKLSWYNRNYVGTHFGGSLYAMVDPFHMLMAIQALGRDYVVWDKSSSIEFVSPGRGTVSADIRLTDTDVAAMRDATADGRKYHPRFDIEIVDEQGTVVARVHKELHVRRARSASAA